MAIKLTLSLDKSNYVALSKLPNVTIDFSEYELAIIASLFVLADYRDVWEDMSDSEWESLSDEIAQILEALYG